MYHSTALAASLISLGLIAGFYYCTYMTRPGSVLRSETFAMILVSVLTGTIALAIPTALVGLWSALSGGFSLAALLGAGADLGGFAALAATALVFRAAVRRANAELRSSATITPLTPRPNAPRPATPGLRKAA